MGLLNLPSVVGCRRTTSGTTLGVVVPGVIVSGVVLLSLCWLNSITTCISSLKVY